MNGIRVNIDLSFKLLADAVKQLSPRKKLLLNHLPLNESMEIPAEHQSPVLGRVQKAKQYPGRLMDWNEAAKKYTTYT